MDQFWAAPPVTRTLTALTLAQSALLQCGLLGYHQVFFVRPWVLKLFPELWRLVTPFFVAGPKLQFFFDLYFMYTYGSNLETNAPRLNAPGDFLTYVLFVSTVILLTAGFFMEHIIFTSALILAFAYTVAQENKGRQVTFLVIKIPIEFLPWSILLVKLILDGSSAAWCDSTGILAAHLYEFLSVIYPKFGGGDGRSYIRTPDFIRRLTPRSTQASRAYGTAFTPTGQTTGPSSSSSSSSSGGWTSSFRSPWSQRGPGRRLG